MRLTHGFDEKLSIVALYHPPQDAGTEQLAAGFGAGIEPWGGDAIQILTKINRSP
ncbi:hypothetical protein D9M71_192470 [compost metagenome]